MGSLEKGAQLLPTISLKPGRLVSYPPDLALWKSGMPPGAVYPQTPSRRLVALPLRSPGSVVQSTALSWDTVMTFDLNFLFHYVSFCSELKTEVLEVSF